MRYRQGLRPQFGWAQRVAAHRIWPRILGRCGSSVVSLSWILPSHGHRHLNGSSVSATAYPATRYRLVAPKLWGALTGFRPGFDAPLMGKMPANCGGIAQRNRGWRDKRQKTYPFANRLRAGAFGPRKWGRL